MTDRTASNTEEIVDMAQEGSALAPQEILRRCIEHFHPRIALCTSLQSDGVVILDMAWRINPELRVFTIDTGRLPQETYEMFDRIRKKYHIEVEVYLPDTAQIENMVRQHGANLFYRNPELRVLCCQIRKVLPLRRILPSLDAWITGQRRDQSPTRATVDTVEIDHDSGGIVKVNPLAYWTEKMVWDYIRAHDVPYHPFYDQGYTSIGCAPCTRPTAPGEDARAGRWWWESEVRKECGMHCSV